MKKTIDKLTGLAFSETFHADMAALIAKPFRAEPGDEFSLIFMDIDNLHAINQNFGMEAGDDVFRLLAKHIKTVFPEPNLAYRDKRDHFNILLPGCGKEEAFLKAEQLRKLIFEEKLNHKSTSGISLSQSVSIGVSSYPEDGSRPADICRRADSALSRAKKTGRNLVCLAREEKLMPKTSHYTQAQLEKLSQISEKIEVGEAALLREALDDLLKKYDIDMQVNFSFEDIAGLQGNIIQDLLLKVDKKMLALSLKGSSPMLKEFLFKHMEHETSAQISKLLEEMGPRPVSEIESAQEIIIDMLLEAD